MRCFKVKENNEMELVVGSAEKLDVGKGIVRICLLYTSDAADE